MEKLIKVKVRLSDEFQKAFKRVESRAVCGMRHGRTNLIRHVTKEMFDKLEASEHKGIKCLKVSEVKKPPKPKVKE